MDTQTDAVAHDEQPRGERGDPDRTRQILASLRAELARSGRRQGYVDGQQWQTSVAHLGVLKVPAEDQTQFATDLAHLAAQQHWLFPEEPLPSDGTSPVDALVTRARAQTQRTRLMTQSYLSAILALGCRWGVRHDELAQALARACAAEHWPVDWEVACEMEGLLGAERASDRQRLVRSQAQQVFEQYGKKGWLSEADLLRLFTSMRGYGVSDADTRDLLASFHLEADARHWAWAGAAVRPRPLDETLDLLVSKVAEQAHRRQRVGEGFHQALMSEAAGANLDAQVLLNAIAERREREHWTAVFDRHWQFDGETSTDGWDAVVGGRWLLPVSQLMAEVAPAIKPVAPTWLRTATPLLLFLMTISLNRPIAASATLPGLQPGSAPAAALSQPPVAPTTVEVSSVATPAPVSIQPLTLVVSHTDGAGARLRTAPVTGPVARLLGEGTSVVVIGSEMQVDGTAWAQVRAPDGTRGWMARDLLSPGRYGRVNRLSRSASTPQSDDAVASVRRQHQARKHPTLHPAGGAHPQPIHGIDRAPLEDLQRLAVLQTRDQLAVRRCRTQQDADPAGVHDLHQVGRRTVGRLRRRPQARRRHVGLLRGNRCNWRAQKMRVLVLKQCQWVHVTQLYGFLGRARAGEEPRQPERQDKQGKHRGNDRACDGALDAGALSVTAIAAHPDGGPAQIREVSPPSHAAI